MAVRLAIGLGLTVLTIWDTQWDMFVCLIGAILAQLLLSRMHDRQLATIHHGLPGTESSPAAHPQC